MSSIITEVMALEIVNEFLNELLTEENKIMALYVIGSLGGGYYRAGQSDIDTMIIVSDDAEISQELADEIAEKYHQKYNIPKGFGSILIRESELSPPYKKSETDEFEFAIELARLKTQGKAIYGSISLDDIKMPSKEDFIKDALIMEHWFDKEFGYPMFDKLQITGCVNCILGILRRFLIIEKGIFEFNKFKTIDTYLRNGAPVIHKKVFEFIRKKLSDEVSGDEDDLTMLRECGIQFRDYFNKRLLNRTSMMKRKVYITDDTISLSEYIGAEDDFDCYNCWQDSGTQSGYNHKFIRTFEEWSDNTSIKSRFIATIIRVSDNTCVGSIFLSPEDTPPDLAIMIYKPYRHQGYGPAAFALGAKYCFETLGLDKIYAGCYRHNFSSMNMLKKCGFVPHPEGNIQEKHYLTGEDITQFDFVKYNPEIFGIRDDFMNLKHRPINYKVDRDYILERHCRINYECDCPWKRKMSYEDYRSEYFSLQSQINGFSDMLTESMKDSRTIAEIIENDNGNIVAYLWVVFNADEESGFYFADVQDIYVEEEFRNMSIAETLMKYAEIKAKDNGAKVIRSGTGIENSKSFNLHEKLGYYQYRYEFEKLL